MILKNNIVAALAAILLMQLPGFMTVPAWAAPARPAVAEENSGPGRPEKAGQREKEQREYRQMLEAFITKEAGLTGTEARSFYPLFHELRSQQREINRKIRQANRRVRHERLSDAEAKKIMSEILNLHRRSVALEEDYYQRWQRCISPVKILKVMDAERRFGRKMFRRAIKQHK